MIVRVQDSDLRILQESIIMPLRKEEMHADAKKRLQTRFTRFDGWELFEGGETGEDGPDFVCTLDIHKKKMKVLCNIIDRPRIRREDIFELTRQARNARGASGEIFRTILAVPGDVQIADTVKNLIQRNRIELMRLENIQSE